MMSRTMSLERVLPCQVSLTASKTRSTGPSQSTARSIWGARNMMADAPPKPSVAKKRRWLAPCPTRERLRMATPRAAKSGRLLPWPKGWSASREAMSSTFISSRVTSAVTSPLSWKSSASRGARARSRASAKAGRLFSSQVTPTAPEWPPKRTSRSEHCSTARKRSTEPTERPEPRAMPSLTEKTIAGTW